MYVFFLERLTISEIEWMKHLNRLILAGWLDQKFETRLFVAIKTLMRDGGSLTSAVYFPHPPSRINVSIVATKSLISNSWSSQPAKISRLRSQTMNWNLEPTIEIEKKKRSQHHSSMPHMRIWGARLALWPSGNVGSATAWDEPGCEFDSSSSYTYQSLSRFEIFYNL